MQKRAYDYTQNLLAEFQAQGKYKYGGADQFIAFLNNELKPEIAKQFPINSQTATVSMGILWRVVCALSFFFKNLLHSSVTLLQVLLWFDQGMLFRELEQWQSQKQTVFPMLMTTVGTHEQGGPHTQFNQRINKDDFFKVLENKRSDHLLYWH